VRGAYTLAFEIKPTSTKPQTVFAHRGQTYGSIIIRLENGKLTGIYYDQRANLIVIKPHLAVPVNEWSKVEVVNNLKDIIFKVNGVAGDPTPYPGPGFANACCVFGGTQPEWFEGYLKSLRIRHASELQ